MSKFQSNGAPGGQQVKAALIVRMSLLRQENSAERQRSQMLPYCQRKGYVVYKEYADLGVRGGDFDKRGGLHDLIGDAQAGKFQVVVMDEWSRQSRQEVLEFLALVAWPLHEAGVWFESVADGVIDLANDMDVMRAVMMQVNACGESRKTSRRMLTRLLLKARAGKYVPPLVPYGYRSEGTGDDKRLVIHEEEAKIVQWIFVCVANRDWRVHRVARELSARGVRPPTGNGQGAEWKERNLWHVGTVRKMLSNRKYVGDMVWGETHQGKLEYRGGEVVPSPRPGQKVRRAEEADVIVVRDAFPAIVDRETFQRVQEALSRNRRQTSPRKEGRHLLARLLVCGNCGGWMVGTTSHRRKAYVCSTYQRKTKVACFRNAMYEDDLRDKIIEALQRDWLNPQMLESLRKELTARVEAEQADGHEERLQKRVAELQGWIDQGNRNLALLPPDRLPGVIAQLREWEEERDRLAEGLAGIATRIKEVEQEVRETEKSLWFFREALFTKDEDALRAVLHDLIGRVELYFTHKPWGKRTRRVFDHGVVVVKVCEEPRHLGISMP
jgi:DNA invertase Pin-like site-specific DNA recombinase